MSSRRPPAPPPALSGFTHEALLGSGGFADVFLYRQHLPERRVAVKVLLPDRLAQGSTDAFASEANIMAQLSTHPAIVTIHQAGVSDDGRPYLVMEYCPRPNLQVRYRREPFSIAESLRVGVQVAAAVETAHRAGILHRDIKPANILVTEYNRPALTDFGIAVATGDDEDSAGMSIPWSPPEAFADDVRAGVTTDVWALAATVYTLLAGRSPFELPGERNTSAELIQRIESMPLPPLGRPDAPASLQGVFERAMSKAPTARYASAIDFARALQRVQIELSMAPTPIDVLEEAGGAADDAHDEDGGLTRIRNVVSIDPSGTTTQATHAAGGAPLFDAAIPSFADAPADDVGETVMRADRDSAAGMVSWAPGSAPGTATGAPRFDTAGTTGAATDTTGAGTTAGATLRRGPAPVAQPTDDDTDVDAEHAAPPLAPKRSQGGLIAAIVAGIVVLGGAGAAWAAASGAFGEADPTPTVSEDSGPIDGVVPDDLAPLVTDLAGTVQGDQVVFTWTNPDPQDGDAYLWGVLRPAEDTQLAKIDDPTITVPVEPGGRTCIEVFLVRAGGRSSVDSEQGCAP